MFSIDDIQEYVKEKKYDFVVDVRFRSSDDAILVYIPQDKIIERAKKGFTSNRQLEFLKNNISSKYNKSVDVIIVQSEDHDELEAGIYRILNRKFDEQIISLYISFSGENRVNVQMEVASSDINLRNNIVEHLRSVLKEANIFLNTISWMTTQSELPTLAYLLRKIKIHQPIEIQELSELLLESYSSISDKWLNRKLDQLRKKGFLLRKMNRSYVLSAMALNAIPAGTRHTSSDIERALALGKRKW
ncbi:hypothetical protein JYT87_01905 [Nitrospira defluvii]|nr:hypothetical protein [Nitrospira defluvii]